MSLYWLNVKYNSFWVYIMADSDRNHLLFAQVQIDLTAMLVLQLYV